MPACVGLDERVNTLVGLDNSGRDGRLAAMLGYVDPHDREKMSVIDYGIFPSSNC